MCAVLAYSLGVLECAHSKIDMHEEAAAVPVFTKQRIVCHKTFRGLMRLYCGHPKEGNGNPKELLYLGSDLTTHCATREAFMGFCPVLQIR